MTRQLEEIGFADAPVGGDGLGDFTDRKPSGTTRRSASDLPLVSFSSSVWRLMRESKVYSPAWMSPACP